MVESKFKIWTLIAIISSLLLLVFLIFVLIGSGISSLPLYAGIPLLLFLLFIITWLVYGELRTKAIKVRIESNTITANGFIGLAPDRVYDLKEFDGYKISILPSEYQEYEYLYLLRNHKKIIKVSQFYHSNYLDIKKAITAKTRNLGEESFNLFRELKESFVA